MTIFELDYFIENVYSGNDFETFILYFNYTNSEKKCIAIAEEKDFNTLKEKFRNFEVDDGISFDKSYYEMLCSINTNYKNKYVVVFSKRILKNYFEKFHPYFYVFDKETLFLNKLSD